MTTRPGLWFGPAAACLLVTGIVAIGLATPGYSHVRQTVSELGEVGAPGRVTFTALLLLVAACLAIFASGVNRLYREAGRSALPAYVIGAMAISIAGVGLFPFPHTLHNVFGLSELVGYQAPLVAALACRNRRGARGGAKEIATFSLAMYCLVLLALATNLAVLDRSGDLWALVRPFNGIAQRSLFAAWFSWCAGYGVLLMRARQRTDSAFRPNSLGGSV